MSSRIKGMLGVRGGGDRVILCDCETVLYHSISDMACSPCCVWQHLPRVRAVKTLKAVSQAATAPPAPPMC